MEVKGLRVRGAILLLGVVLVLGSLVRQAQAEAAAAPTAGSLVRQAQAEAAAAPTAGFDSRICCKDQLARECLFAFCVNATAISIRCAEMACRCKILSPGSRCPPGYPNSNLLADKDDLANEYCRVGCRSSVCDNIVNVDADGSQEMKVTVERCGDACGRTCVRRRACRRRRHGIRCCLVKHACMRAGRRVSVPMG